MSDLRAAAQQALEALELPCPRWNGTQSNIVNDAITALRAALAEPVQEPIGYLWPTGRHPEFRFTQQKRDGVDGTPVYTSPPQQPNPDRIHSCSYYCMNPACIKAQRDELRDKMFGGQNERSI